MGTVVVLDRSALSVRTVQIGVTGRTGVIVRIVQIVQIEAIVR
jgi:hypothetical protein